MGRELRWPTLERRIEGWHCVVFPCFEDLEDAVQQTLDAHGAVVPAADDGSMDEDGMASNSGEADEVTMGHGSSAPAGEGGPVGGDAPMEQATPTLESDAEPTGEVAPARHAQPPSPQAPPGVWNTNKI